MVAHATSGSATAAGLRPINSMRDLAGVTTLVEQVFADDMDAAGRKSMREMRWIGTWFGWADFLASPGQGLMPGYVWVEQGRIVGNVTVRRLSILAGGGWMIGNVAVAPEWRGRGIARRLMEAAVELVRHNGGDWVALQVRSDNAIARGLYQSLGFVETGELVYFEHCALRADGIASPQRLPAGRVRPARSNDMDRLYMLAQGLVPDSVRWAEPVDRGLFDLSTERRLTDWFSATQRVWRVADMGDQIGGAALLVAHRRQRIGRLHLWTTLTYAGQIEQALTDSVLYELAEPLDLTVAHVAGQCIGGRVALTTRGFRQTRALTSMKLTLSER